MKTMWFVIKILIVSLLIASIIITGTIIYYKTNIEPVYSKNNETNLEKNFNQIKDNSLETQEDNEGFKVELQGGNKRIVEEDWRIILVNSENPLPENLEIKLSKINGSAKEFDSRAVLELTTMMKDMKTAGVPNIWVQSAYRSTEYQENLYNNKVQEFIVMGKNYEDAERLASKWVNKSETSEHSLGLAVDFNNVKPEFENTREFAWLVENAENYGFVLRYKKEKKNITKVNYEPWHWRYVGKEHAIKMNELDMCLEEYVEYLNENH